MHTEEEFRELMRERIRAKNWNELFTGGACYFFAVVLHEELKLPLFYASPPYSNEFRHVFVMCGRECLDYLGKHPVEEIAKKYSEWPDVCPRPTTVNGVMARVKEKGFGPMLELELFAIARAEFVRNRQRYT